VVEVITGVDSVDELEDLQQELISLLKIKGLSLQKWSSNRTSVLQGISAKQTIAIVGTH